jgi:hypothetical protein
MEATAQGMNDQQHLYFTIDGLSFFEEGSAQKHADRLQDKTITTRTADEVCRELPATTTASWETEMEELLEDLSGL